MNDFCSLDGYSRSKNFNLRYDHVRLKSTLFFIRSKKFRIDSWTIHFLSDSVVRERFIDDISEQFFWCKIKYKCVHKWFILFPIRSFVNDWINRTVKNSQMILFLPNYRATYCSVNTFKVVQKRFIQ